MSSSSIQPGCCDDTLSKDDLCRAYFCSEAVYKSSVTSATAFLQRTQCDHPIVRFEKVHMSLELLGQQKFLVAYAEDAIFIAFRGTATLHDLATDLTMVNYPNFGGAFHAGFFMRADVFIRSDRNPMKGLLSLNKRIIFCGHSLGGAVAHMVLLRYFLENNWKLNENSQAQYPNSLISVAFGAPHICDEKGALNINANKTLRWRFKNFVNQSDPVPCLLHSVANTLAKFRASLKSNEIFRTSFPLEGGVTPLVTFIDAILRRDVRVAFFGALDIGTTGIVDKSKILIAPLLKELARRAAPEPGSIKYNESDFYPIGYYTFIEKKADERRNTDRQKYDVYTIDDERSHMTRKLKDVRLRFQDWEHHKLKNYKTVLMESDLIDSPPVNSQQPHDCQTNNVVSTPAPIITTTLLERADSTQPAMITITGDNLLFLREPVKINEMEWETTVQEDQKIIALGPSSSSISTETILFVVVNTAFGKYSNIIMEGFPKEQPTTAIRQKLENIVQFMMIMKRFGSDPSSDHLSKLDAIIQCGPKMQSKKLSTTLEKIRTTESDNEVHLQEANKMTKAVIDFLTSPLKISYRKDMKVIVGVIWTVIATLFFSLLRDPIQCVRMMVAAKATMVAGSTKYKFLRPRLVESYEEILVIACEEASEWSMSNPRLGVDLTYLKPSSLEERLQKQVQMSTDIFKEMIQKAHTYPQTQGDQFVRILSKLQNGDSQDLGKEILIQSLNVRRWAQLKRILPKLQYVGQETSPKLKHRYAKSSDHKCRISFLRRIKIIVDTEKLFTEVVKRTKFWGFLGTEDAGKSTFIKKALKNYGPPNSKLPKCGRSTHTTIVEPYQLYDSVWLVDFPGNDGLGGYAEKWTQFQALPSFYVLILEFQNDIKQGQKELYDKITSEIGTSEIKVVFNKVDINFYPGEDEDDEADYFEKQKDNTLSKLGCERENIYYVCFEPRISDEKMQALKNMGVLGFEEFFNELRLHSFP